MYMAKFQDLDHLKIPFEVIRLATNNFAEDIGNGGYGKVYKGQLPHPNSSGEPSTTVAVKRLDMRYGQGQHEFSTEINMLASYKHSNLVSLVGFSEDGDEKIVVYKYEINGSLDKHLASTDLTWEQRLRICIGAARGLEYLHAGVGPGHRVLHRDIKSANILLDENWKAKISDFGFSRIGLTNQPITFLFTGPCGTLGYVDPQYHKTGILTKESDVYSFGVVLFEVLCGKPAYEIYKYDGEESLLNNLVKRHYEEGKIDEIIMPSIREQKNMYSLQKFSDIAYQCLNETRNQRPLMNHIVKELQSIECQVGSPTGLWGSKTGGTPRSLLLDNNKNPISEMVKKSNTKSSSTKRPRNENPPMPPLKVHEKVKLGDRITALQQLVSPFGKSDTAYIKFLHEQVNVLSTPYMNNAAIIQQQKQISDKPSDGSQQI